MEGAEGYNTLVLVAPEELVCDSAVLDAVLESCKRLEAVVVMDCQTAIPVPSVRAEKSFEVRWGCPNGS